MEICKNIHAESELKIVFRIESFYFTLETSKNIPISMSVCCRIKYDGHKDYHQ